MKLHGHSVFPCLFFFLAALLPAVSGQSANSGSIVGRVSNQRNGEYLENVRISVDGAAHEVFTDVDGYFRLTNVPPGTTRVRVFFTGMQPVSVEIAVGPGQTAERNIALAPLQRAEATPAPDGTVRLSRFVVEESREMDAAAVAINEQRFAPNVKTVVSTDEFGSTAESNPGEFLKFMPGISIDYNAGNAREVSINGVPPGNVPVMLDGFSIASTANGDTARSTGLDFLSLNSASRIELNYSPTPESPGSALAGSVNIVPRSSFGFARRVVKASAYLTMRDDERDFHRTPGPRDEPTRKVHPGFDFSAVVPVNKRFGFSLSAGRSVTYTSQESLNLQWRGVSVPTNGTAFPHTTPDRPYLTQFIVRNPTTDGERRAYGVTVDYRLTEKDRLSFSYQWSAFTSNIINRNLTFNVNRVIAFTPTSTRGEAGAGSLAINSDGGLDRHNRTYMPTLLWRHDGPVWKAEAGTGLSFSTNRVRGIDKGFFNGNSAQRTGVTVSFDDIFYLRPRVITVTDASGAPVNPYVLSTYSVTSANSVRRNASDEQRTAYTNLRRAFQGRLPLTLKAGLDFRQLTRDARSDVVPYRYLGADRRASTTPVGNDDSAAPFVDDDILRRSMPFGFPNIEWLSPERMYEGYVANPQHWEIDENTRYRNRVTMSLAAREIISSAFLRGDLQLLENRLKLVGGVRAEQTNVKAFGPLTDAARNVRRDAQGRPILAANGRPQAIATDPLEIARLTFIERGNRVDREFLRVLPNINAAYNLRENLILRAAYYHSLGRPLLNQYAGALTLPDTESLPSATNRIVVTNPSIKPWTAETTNVRLEYYFQSVGMVSIGAFRRDFDNFFGGVVTPVTAEFLEPFGLDYSSYSGFDVATQYNLEGTVRMTGVEVNYKQALTFLPKWARGVQVFANGSAMRATGPALANFTGMNMIPRSGSWGISLTRERFNLRANWNYRGRQRDAQVTGVGIEPGTWNWTSKRLAVDLLGEFHFTRSLSLFANLRNIRDQPIDAQTLAPSAPEHAQFRSRNHAGSMWTFGVKGTF